MTTGRPSKYDKDYHPGKAYKLCLLGATDAELADFFEIAESTLYLWKDTHPEFSEVLKAGKVQADAEVAHKLLHRAKGYSHPEDKIFLYEGTPVVVPTTKHYPPDPTSAIFWLKNRQRGRWRDVRNTEVSGEDGGPIKTEQTINLENLSDKELEFLERISEKATAGPGDNQTGGN